MAVRCQYCAGEPGGGFHAGAAEVRACWQKHQGTFIPSEGEPAASRLQPHDAAAPLDIETAAVAGRNLVIAPGGPVPLAWEAAERIRVDEAVLGDAATALATLQAARAERRPVVVELAVPLDTPPGETYTDPVWRLTPDFHFPLERLHHLVWCHSVDLRSPDTPRLGAEVLLGRRIALEDGAVLDGGPPAPSVLPGRLVPFPAVEHGRTTPVHAVPPVAELADDQLAAVAHEGGPARIIAPAGSGKTRVLTERARLLLRGWGLPASAVCLVAFNTRAAQEMRERTTDLPGLQIRTLNSLALAIVSGSGPFAAPPGGTRPSTIDEPAVRRLLGDLVELPRKASTDPAAAWLEALGQVRLGLRSPRAVEAAYGGDVDGFEQFFDRYRETLARRNEVDFDDQIYRAIELLCRHPELRRAAQRACRVLLVDEFQDLTPAHLLLVRLVAAPGYDVFGVGDDDQTIYGYNGADPGWLIDYERYFPGAASHPLTVNYRCAPGVVAAADTLLGYNTRRVAKEIHPAPGRPSRPGDLRIERADDPVAATVDHIRRLVESGTAPSDIAVLTRVNVTLAPVQLALAAAGVPVESVVDERLLGRSSVRAALAWLRLARDPERLTPALIAESARRPSRGLSPRVVEWMGEQRSLDGLERLAERLRDRDAAKVAAYANDIRRVAARAHRPTAEVLAAVFDLGLAQAARQLDRARSSVDRSTHTDDLRALIDLGRLQPDAARFGEWLGEALARPGDPAGVRLLTVHRSKGLEWPEVVVHGVTAGALPHELAGDESEERRILHVAITRSRAHTLVVTDAAAPSPFLDELEGIAPPPSERPESTTEPASRPGRGGTAAGAPGARRAPAGPPVVAAAVGLEFEIPGYTVTVVEVTETGVLVSTGGRARQSVAFGAEVRVDGRLRVLAPADAAGPDGDTPLVGADAELFEELRTWRAATAKALKRPAYTILKDDTLRDLVRARPGDLGELLEIKGIGPTKAEQWGDELLGVLASGGG